MLRNFLILGLCGFALISTNTFPFHTEKCQNHTPYIPLPTTQSRSQTTFLHPPVPNQQEISTHPAWNKLGGCRSTDLNSTYPFIHSSNMRYSLFKVDRILCQLQLTQGKVWGQSNWENILIRQQAFSSSRLYLVKSWLSQDKGRVSWCGVSLFRCTRHFKFRRHKVTSGSSLIASGRIIAQAHLHWQ